MRITVVGAGYVGLSNAVLLAQSHDVCVLDLDADKVKDWLSKGAQPSEPVARLIKAAGIE